MAGEPDLHPNEASGEWVQYLQDLLGSAGYTATDEAGTYSDGTEQTVRQFQESNECTVDGWVGAETWSALLRVTGFGGGEDEAASADGDVPAEIVALGFPTASASFTDEQRQSVFVGRDVEEDEEAGAPEGFELLAVNEEQESGEAYA